MPAPNATRPDPLSRDLSGRPTPPVAIDNDPHQLYDADYPVETASQNIPIQINNEFIKWIDIDHGSSTESVNGSSSESTTSTFSIREAAVAPLTKRAADVYGEKDRFGRISQRTFPAPERGSDVEANTPRTATEAESDTKALYQKKKAELNQELNQIEETYKRLLERADRIPKLLKNAKKEAKAKAEAAHKLCLEKRAELDDAEATYRSLLAEFSKAQNEANEAKKKDALRLEARSAAFAVFHERSGLALAKRAEQATDPAERAALREKAHTTATALPDGKGVDTIHELVRSAKDPAERTVLRTAAIDLPNGKGVYTLQILKETATNSEERATLHDEAHTAALAVPNLKRAYTSEELTRSAEYAVEFDALRIAAIFLPNGEGASSLKTLSEIESDPEKKIALRSEALTAAIEGKNRIVLFELGVMAESEEERIAIRLAREQLIRMGV